jgi:hypothetical protein
MARYLIVANLTGESPALRGCVPRMVQDDSGAEFVIATPPHPLSHWLRRDLPEVVRCRPPSSA